MPQSIVEEILRFNAGRDPRRLERKYAAMRADAFAFLRGTCHLFYQGLPAESLVRRAPLAWICGDLHLGNFGAYKADNRLAYFDLNDFDEACLAPCTWDPLRLVASVFASGAALGYGERDAARLGRACIDAYAEALRDGKARWIERPLATGIVRDLLRELKRTRRARFLDRRTTLRGRRRRLRRDGERALPAAAPGVRRASALVALLGRGHEPRGFFRVLDVADRIAGTGSLGVERWAVLVEGRGSPDGNFLIDLKAALPSATARHSPATQPGWGSEAERVAEVQRVVQAMPPALLAALGRGPRSYVARELQPAEHRLDLAPYAGRLARLEGALRTLGELSAWGQLRAAGWRGGAARGELAEFGGALLRGEGLLELARERARAMAAAWGEFRAAFAAGRIAPG